MESVHDHIARVDEIHVVKRVTSNSDLISYFRHLKLCFDQRFYCSPQLRALQEKQSVLLRRRKQTLDSPFENHRPEDVSHSFVSFPVVI